MKGRASRCVGPRRAIASSWDAGQAEIAAEKLRGLSGGQVSGDDSDAREQVCQPAETIGVRAWHAGPLANSAAAEALTSVLISINKRYKITDGAGIRIVGEPAH